MTTIKIHNALTGEITERELNSEEIAELELNKAESQAKAEAEAIKQAARAEILAKLGLTEDEAKLLLQ